MDRQEILKDQLSRLQDEHQHLDTMIDEMMRENVVNQIAVQRLKKKKLLVRDQIKHVMSKLLPDIIA